VWLIQLGLYQLVGARLTLSYIVPSETQRAVSLNPRREILNLTNRKAQVFTSLNSLRVTHRKSSKHRRDTAYEIEKFHLQCTTDREVYMKKQGKLIHQTLPPVLPPDEAL